MTILQEAPHRPPDTLQLLQNFPPGQKHICVTKKDKLTMALEILDGEFNRRIEKDTVPAHLHPLIGATSLVGCIYS